MNTQRIIPALPANIAKGDFIIYSNGQTSFYTGTVMQVKEKTLVLLDTENEAAVTLWGLGTAVGTEIYADQIKQVIKAAEFEQTSQD